MSFKKLFRISSILLIAVFFVGALPWRELRADANIHGDYSCDRLSVTYDQTTAWDLNTQGEFVITNVSEETVEGWTLQFEFAADLTITNLWNGQDLRNETTPANILIIGNEAYNGTIAPGQSVSFGLIMTGYEFAPVAPLNATLPVAAEPVPEEIPAEPEVISAVDPSTCVIFAGSDITISGWRTTIEGNVYAGNSFNFQGSELSVAGTVNSEGTVTITGYSSVVSGTQEGAAHVDIPDLSEEIFSISNELTVLDSLSDAPVNGYYYSEDNISIDVQALEGEAVSVSEGDIEVNVDTISGENNITLYSVNGNITINCNQAVLSGTVYAPNGRVTLNTNEITVVGKILSNELVFNGSVLTVTNNPEDTPEITPEPTVTVEPTATVTPVPTEEPTATPTPTPVEEEEPDPTPTPEAIDETLDSDEDGIPDSLEIEIGTNPNDPDTDGDGLNDYLEIMVGYDPTIQDTDGNGILDGEEDLDNDGVCNVNELSLETDILSEDTDGDRLKDGEELYTYGTDPKNPDSDGDGIFDGDEIAIGKDPLDPSDATIRIEQTKIQEITNEEDPAITSVEVTMSLAGSIDRSLTIRDMYNVDFYTTAVAGRIGSPISFECVEDFDTATVVIHYSEAALGDTAESDLGILWYDEENGIFVEQEQAILDSSNNMITVELEHFSEYILVDLFRWRSNLPTTYMADASGRYTDRSNGVELCFNVDLTNGLTDEEKAVMIDYMEEILSMTQDGDRIYFYIFDRNTRLVACNFDPYTSITEVPSEMKNQIYDFDGMTQSVWLQRHNHYVLNDYVDLGQSYISVSFASGTYHALSYPPRTRIYITDNPAYSFEFNLLTNNTIYMNSIRRILGGGVASSLLDEDEDGIPDNLEVEGMFGLNGQIYYSNSQERDTDGDGVFDNEEMGQMYRIHRTGANSVTINSNSYQISELDIRGYTFLEQYIPANIYEVCNVFAVKSVADDPDSDDDGCDDLYDARKLITNQDCVYIIYNNTDSGFCNIANYMTRKYDDTYEVFPIEAPSRDDFISAWENMGRVDGRYQYNLKQVILIYHGYDGYMMFDGEGQLLNEWLRGNPTFYNPVFVAELEPAVIDTLKLIVCYAGTLEYTDPNGDYNLAVGFLLSDSTINHVIASDGSYEYRCHLGGYVGFEEYSKSDIRGIERFMVSYSYPNNQIDWQLVDIEETGVYRYYGI